jgi:hypothetical protein
MTSQRDSLPRGLRGGPGSHSVQAWVGWSPTDLNRAGATLPLEAHLSACRHIRLFTSAGSMAAGPIPARTYVPQSTGDLSELGSGWLSTEK